MYFYHFVQARPPSGNPHTSPPSAEEEEQEQHTPRSGTPSAAAEASIGDEGRARDGEMVEVPGQQNERGCYLKMRVLAAFVPCVTCACFVCDSALPRHTLLNVFARFMSVQLPFLGWGCEVTHRGHR